MDKTLEQKASLMTLEIIVNMIQVIEHHDTEALIGIKDYLVRELENQRKITIEKVCEWLMQNYGRFDGKVEDFVNDFRKNNGGIGYEIQAD